MFNWVELADRDALSRASLVQEPVLKMCLLSRHQHEIEFTADKPAESKDQGPNVSAISANSKEGRSPGHSPGYTPATVNVTLTFLYQQYKTVCPKSPSSAANQSFYPT